MPYMTLENTWTTIENYSGPVTLSLPEWRKYVASGKNVLYGSGGVIPGGTMNTPFGGGGAVYAGNVRQGIEPFIQNNEKKQCCL
jgi:hypothetical protein